MLFYKSAQTTWRVFAPHELKSADTAIALASHGELSSVLSFRRYGEPATSVQILCASL